MSVPNSRNWKAVELPNVQVTGEVEANSPSLHKRVPQSLNPRVLMLDLSKVDDGSEYKKVEYEEQNETDAYDEVEIFYLGQEVSRIVVEHSKATTRKGSTRGAKKRAKPTLKESIKKKKAKKTKKTSANKKTTPRTNKVKKKSRTKASRKKRI